MRLSVVEIFSKILRVTLAKLPVPAAYSASITVSLATSAYTIALPADIRKTQSVVRTIKTDRAVRQEATYRIAARLPCFLHYHYPSSVAA
jgi:hypothetical protein